MAAKRIEREAKTADPSEELGVRERRGGGQQSGKAAGVNSCRQAVGAVASIVAFGEMVQEISLLEEAWQRISTNGAVAYGRADIQRATEEGAVDTLLIGADVLREDEAPDGQVAWSQLAESVEKFSGKVIQCSVDHDAGEQLLGFGGAVALLRYAM